MQASFRICAAFLCCTFPFACMGQTAPAPASSPLAGRPAPEATTSLPTGSTIDLDVVVTDKSGKPVPGLDVADFTLLDNNQPSKIVSFHAYDGTAQSDPPVEAMILFDTVNTTFSDIAFARQQVQEFLRRDGGRLAVPTSVVWLTNDGLEVQREPSLDGNAMAAQLEAAEGRLRTINRSAGAYGAIERFQFCTHMLDELVRSEMNKPGRKLLIWASNGWPILDGPRINISDKSQRALYGEIIQLSTLMRLARIDLYSISQGMPGRDTFLYEAFLKPVKKPQQADIPNLNLKVLAVQSGGRVLPPNNDLPGSLKTCLQDAGAYYRLSFAPAPADGPNQYHEVKIRIGKPGLSARTNTGYYDQPMATSAP